MQNLEARQVIQPKLVNPRLRVLLADDNAALLAAVAKNLGWDFDVVGAVGDGATLIQEFDRLHPDVVVTDISMPGEDGFQVAAELRGHGSPPIVFFTVHEDSAFLDEAKALGVRGYVLKRSPPSVLAAAIRAAHAGSFFVSPEFGK